MLIAAKHFKFQTVNFIDHQRSHIEKVRLTISTNVIIDSTIGLGNDSLYVIKQSYKY